MTPTTPGLHHVTAIAGDPQRNADFYVGVLGLRFVKKNRQPRRHRDLPLLLR
nr:VOC family protein [Halomicroarcula sp. SYNS111]